jgi:hypothetical protein
VRGFEMAEDDAIAFEKRVGFVGGEEEWNGVIGKCGDGRAHGDFPVIAQWGVVGPDEFTEAHKSVEAWEKDSDEKKIIVGGGMCIGVMYSGEVRASEGSFAGGASGEAFCTTSKGPDDKVMGTVMTNIGIERFKLRTNAGEVCLDRIRLQKVRYVDNIEGECVRSGLRGKCMWGTESEVGLKSRRVREQRGAVQGHAPGNGALVEEALTCPDRPRRLSRHPGSGVHVTSAPSVSRGGMKGVTDKLGAIARASVLWKRESASATGFRCPGTCRTRISASKRMSKSTVVMRMGL